MSRLQEQDYGTPPAHQSERVTLEIDGLEIEAPQGTSIMRAALLAGISIPKLCATDTLDAFGSCRLCLVEIEGKQGTPSSCTTPVAAGMVVHTQTQRLSQLRKGVMELYVSDHPLDCLTCSANGDCELQDVAGEVGVREVRFDVKEHHLQAETDTSNPYFNFDPSRCIVCARCVRACNDIQGSFALNLSERGFDAHISTGGTDFFDSECVSCGACVATCPTAALMEKSVVEEGMPDRTVLTTCAYCGVGCSFKAEVKGQKVVRMLPQKSGKANHGHSCVKGRFAWSYATHPDRITVPMIRSSIEADWQKVSWQQAIDYAATQLKSIQQQYGRTSIGAITSSRCTNEEVWLVQKMVRAGFANNNIDTCARVCHSPTGYGLKQTFGTSAGTQDFDSIDAANLILLIGANPTDAHPVFASHMKQRVRQGVRLIVADPRTTGMVRSPHVKCDIHLALKPGTNVPLINAMANCILQEGLHDPDFVATRCDRESFESWKSFILKPENTPAGVASTTGIPQQEIEAAARMYAQAGNAAIYYGLGVTEHSQGSTMVMGLANLAMLTGNIGREGVGVNPLRGQNNVQGSCDMGSFPHEFAGYRPVSDAAVRASFETYWNTTLDGERGLRIPNMFDAACSGDFKGFYIQGEDVAQSDPNIQHVEAALRAMNCVIVQDLFLNETSRFAHVFLPGTSFLEKDGTFINAERRINRVRPVMKPLPGLAEWEVTQQLCSAFGYSMNYRHPREIMQEIAALTPTFSGVSFEFLDRVGSVQWPCNTEHPEGTPVMHVNEFVCGKGRFVTTAFVPTEERTTSRFPLILTTGRKLAQYNVGTQTRRTRNNLWLEEDLLQIHPSDAEARGIRNGDWVALQSRKGEISLRAQLSENILPGVVYTTFHHPDTGTNVLTTELSDWATECPEYKVTAVQITPANHKSDWQLHHAASSTYDL